MAETEPIDNSAIHPEPTWWNMQSPDRQQQILESLDPYIRSELERFNSGLTTSQIAKAEREQGRQTPTGKRYGSTSVASHLESLSRRYPGIVVLSAYQRGYYGIAGDISTTSSFEEAISEPSDSLNEDPRAGDATLIYDYVVKNDDVPADEINTQYAPLVEASDLNISIQEGSQHVERTRREIVESNIESSTEEILAIAASEGVSITREYVLTLKYRIRHPEKQKRSHPQSNHSADQGDYTNFFDWSAVESMVRVNPDLTIDVVLQTYPQLAGRPNARAIASQGLLRVKKSLSKRGLIAPSISEPTTLRDDIIVYIDVHLKAGHVPTPRELLSAFPHLKITEPSVRTLIWRERKKLQDEGVVVNPRPDSVAIQLVDNKIIQLIDAGFSRSEIVERLEHEGIKVDGIASFNYGRLNATINRMRKTQRSLTATDRSLERNYIYKQLENGELPTIETLLIEFPDRGLTPDICILLIELMINQMKKRLQNQITVQIEINQEPPELNLGTQFLQVNSTQSKNETETTENDSDESSIQYTERRADEIITKYDKMHALPSIEEVNRTIVEMAGHNSSHDSLPEQAEILSDKPLSTSELAVVIAGILEGKHPGGNRTMSLTNPSLRELVYTLARAYPLDETRAFLSKDYYSAIKHLQQLDRPDTDWFNFTEEYGNKEYEFLAWVLDLVNTANASRRVS